MGDAIKTLESVFCFSFDEHDSMEDVIETLKSVCVLILMNRSLYKMILGL